MYHSMSVYMIVAMNMVFTMIGLLTPNYPVFKISPIGCRCYKTRVDLIEVFGKTYGIEMRFLSLLICIFCSLGQLIILSNRISRLVKQNESLIDKIIKLQEPKVHVTRQTITQSSSLEPSPGPQSEALTHGAAPALPPP